MNPERLDAKFLEQFPEFVAFKEGNVGTDNERARRRRRTSQKGEPSLERDRRAAPSRCLEARAQARRR